MIILVILFRSYRPTFWEVEDKEKLKERSLRRVRCLLGTTPRDQVEAEVRVTTFPLFFCQQASHYAQCLVELDLYGLGRARSLEEFQQHTGVEFKTRQIGDKVLACVINPACVCLLSSSDFLARGRQDGVGCPPPCLSRGWPSLRSHLLVSHLTCHHPVPLPLLQPRK